MLWHSCEQQSIHNATGIIQQTASFLNASAHRIAMMAMSVLEYSLYQIAYLIPRLKVSWEWVSELFLNGTSAVSWELLSEGQFSHLYRIIDSVQKSNLTWPYCNGSKTENSSARVGSDIWYHSWKTVNNYSASDSWLNRAFHRPQKELYSLTEQYCTPDI